MNKRTLGAIVLSFLATYIASFSFIYLLFLMLSVHIAATIALIVIASVGVCSGYLGGRPAAYYHGVVAVLAACLSAVTALEIAREMDNPAQRSPPFLAYAAEHVGLGLTIFLAISFASLVGLSIGRAARG